MPDIVMNSGIDYNKASIFTLTMRTTKLLVSIDFKFWLNLGIH